MGSEIYKLATEIAVIRAEDVPPNLKEKVATRMSKAIDKCQLGLKDYIKNEGLLSGAQNYLDNLLLGVPEGVCMAAEIDVNVKPLLAPATPLPSSSGKTR